MVVVAEEVLFGIGILVELDPALPGVFAHQQGTLFDADIKPVRIFRMPRDILDVCPVRRRRECPQVGSRNLEQGRQLLPVQPKVVREIEHHWLGAAVQADAVCAFLAG